MPKNHRAQATLDLGDRTQPCSAYAAMEESLTRPDSDGLYVLPTTHWTLAAIPQWLEESAGAVVGEGVPGTLSPSELLTRLKTGGAQRPRIAIVFSDQLVSPQAAPLLVEHAGVTQYLSALEVVAHVRYRFRVKAWTRNGFRAAPAQCDPSDVLRLLLRHHSACESLGDQWLMREAQAKRSPTYRINQVHRRLQLFHSVVLYAFQDSPLPAEYQPAIRRIGEMRKALTGSSRA